MSLTQAYAAHSATSRLEPFEVERRDPGPKEVELELAYCGVCHTDVHQVRDEWRHSAYPMVPGHEIVGRVVRSGSKARKFKVGDAAGVGCMVDSCRRCASCRQGLEQHCESGPTWTYNSLEKDGRARTYGGYSARLVVHEDFALRVAAGQPLELVAPLLCAGITTYSPLKRFGVGRGDRVAVLGFGGLGHMGVKLAKAMGAEVAVLSRSAAKKADALRMGASEFFLEDSADERLAGRFDLILDTVSADHDLDLAMGCLKVGGTLVLVGAPPNPLAVGAFTLLSRKAATGSMIGGLPETQEMLDFCARKKIYPEVEVIPIHQVNEAYERLLRADVRYRFVIDLKTL